MTPPLISLFNVRQRYSGRTVLSVDRLDITPGSIVGLAGPNGSGKSTLLRLLAFLEPPASGTMTFEGSPASSSSSPGPVHRQVTLLVQEPYLLRRSVHGNVAYGLKVRGETDVTARVNAALEAVGLDAERFARRQWFELSGGEAQRVALAARLVLRPKALLMDEPTASLDSSSAALVRQAALAARSRYNTALVIASHDMAWLHAVCDHVLHLENGLIIEQKTLKKSEEMK
ncbi:MAG: energy-coupling factor ABC transporter ATP-binding protein [Pseudodesulfovibrio sp.]|uniref:ABC transporter related protein n=1 Tax=Pseudodesulfovibrio aespoeensis (strain ATCC 700646 / DSM 10631 / Aspo-2) TaxID=643562 RepID=E6VV91_PSEA9|nr:MULTISPECIES: ABC transporter ATP-binding protein [Pseudodesulfovibrio]MBU4191644.1 energy-coupling factor ABC transporter ATP-binding protein [Pseudomonadota bacterium]ADU62335.1 ABC transporter related protein [Pseudodesulfovibrio aespoeensis Aspo-2]MBU4243737.1 energy-coupling factor ABC transporter ATP-binding protein [Pseudomonadota bacterium]MBU4379921.1 energy-coupling factor ABC transporter ATP-binding protein [Pseudomonadota bacterium]MBU4474000.1 energy-coupling factor ABC transpo